jgi:hypothetical protein
MANKKVKFELTAVDKTKAAFDKVTKSLKGVGGAAKSASKGVAGVGLAAVASAAALGVLVNKSFQFIDAIGKTSTMTGIATNTIQAFHLAARESGTDIEGANKALVKFARSVGDAQRGLKTMKDIFKALGVELETSDGNFKSTDQLLAEVASGISNLGSQTQKATALANLFGRQGNLLTGALEDLSEKGLDQFIDRAERLGLILSNKTIRRVEEFNDAVGVIKMQIGSFVNNVSASFLPIFEEMRKTIAEKIEAIIEKYEGIDGVAVMVQNSIIEFAARSIIAIGNFGDTLFATFQKAQIKFLEFERTVLDFNKTLLNLSFKDTTDEIERLNAKILDNKGKTLDAKNATSDYGERAEAVADILRSKYMITLEDLRDGQDAFTKALVESNNELDRTNPIIAFKDNLNAVSKTLDTIAVNSMKKFEDSIVQGLKTGKLSFKDFADYVIDQLIRIAIQQYITAQLLDPFRTFLSGFEPFLSDRPAGIREWNQMFPDGGDPFTDTFDGGGYTGMGARTGGVDGRGGFPAILHPNETVIDHTKGQSVQSAPTVNFNISTVDASGFDELLASRKGLITSIINNAMNNRGRMGVT